MEYNKWIKESLEMFENSIIWAVETYKILSAKEGNDVQPLNQKKMKKKWPSAKSSNWCVFQSFLSDLIEDRIL